MNQILIVEDNLSEAKLLKKILNDAGYESIHRETMEKAESYLKNNTPALIFLDLKLPGKSGLELLESLKKRGSDIPVIIVSAYGAIDDAVKAIKIGAYDFIEKPLDANRIRITVKNCISGTRHKKEIQFLKGLDDKLIGESEVINNLKQKIDIISREKIRVFLTGPTGVGKNLVARLIHKKSPFTMKPFIHVNCAALPEELIESELFGHRKGAFTGATRDKMGRFEEATDGTLFLDEIAEIPPSVQVKLLDFMETGEIQPVGSVGKKNVDTRIIAATNKDVKKAVSTGELREDLYYRLNVVHIDIPPLKDWITDVPILFKYFLKRYSGEDIDFEIDDDVKDYLMNYHWPGNVREVRNLAERISVFSGQKSIDISTLKLFWQSESNRKIEIDEQLGLIEARKQFEKEFIEIAIRKTDGNISEAARILNVNRSSLYKKLNKLNIEY